MLSVPAALSVPQVLAVQFVPLAVSFQVVLGLLEKSFCTLAATKTWELPAKTFVSLLWMVTMILAGLIVKLSESDFDPSCTEVAVSVGWFVGTDVGGV